MMLIDHFICKKEDYLDSKAKEINKVWISLWRDLEVLIHVLDRNIHDPRKAWGFHFDDIKKQVESCMAQLWIYCKDLPDIGSLP